VLKTEQKHAIKQLFFCGVLLAVLPTAFGKSLVFQLLVLEKTNTEKVLRTGCLPIEVRSRELWDQCKMGLTSLHNFYSWYIYHSLFHHSTFFGGLCCVISMNFKCN